MAKNVLNSPIFSVRNFILTENTQFRTSQPSPSVETLCDIFEKREKTSGNIRK